MRRFAVLVLALLALSGCAVARTSEQRRAALARQISDDAAAFNEAYGQAVSGQILLNVMRGRDRLPRFYLSMTGIADAPSVTTSESGGIGGVPLGGGGTPWGIGNVGVSRESSSRPAYAVQPFDAATLTRTAFEPLQPYVFVHYWQSGWPRDLLLLLMADRIETVDGDGGRRVFINEANEIFDDCPDSVTTGGCDFVRELRAFLAAADAGARGNDIDVDHGQGVCGLIQAIAPAHPVKPQQPAAGQTCPPVFITGATRVTLRLRSLDDMIYYVGELLRAGSMDPNSGAIEAQVTVRAAGLRGGGVGVPLFRVIRGGDPRAHYAATIDYGGARYVAGPAIGRSCGAATPSGACRDDAEHGDRSSSVLSLIAELMALNQSPDAIRAPDRIFTQ